MKRGEKSATVIDIMERNRDKSYDVVSAMIEKKLGITNKAARAYYQYMVHNGKVEGIEITWGRGKRSASTSKSVKAKPAKAKAKADKIIKSVELNATEIAAIKAKNLETMRAVSKANRKVRDYTVGKVAKDDGEGVANFDPRLAREEVDQILRDEKLIDQVPRYAHLEG
jgi:hypothetical protein